MTEEEISNLSVESVITILSSMTGKDLSETFLISRNRIGSTADISATLKNHIYQNRDTLQQTRIDIQQTRIESQQTRLDLSSFKDEFSVLLRSFQDKIDGLIGLNNQRSKSIIDDVALICEDQLEARSAGKKRKLSETEEELLSLTDPYYVPTGDDIYGSQANSEQEEDEGDDEDGNEAQMNETAVETSEHPEAQRDYSQIGQARETVSPISGQPTASDAATDSSSEKKKAKAKKEPLYKMIRGTDSIQLIWDEYTRGINGGPAVKDLEITYQGRWKDDTERKYFSYRKKLYSLIEKIMAVDHKTEKEAVDYAESLLIDSTGAKRSMTWLYENTPERFR